MCPVVRTCSWFYRPLDVSTVKLRFYTVHVSRLRLLPGFLPPEEADWIFSRLLPELPWSQKTNYRQGELAADSYPPSKLVTVHQLKERLKISDDP